MAPVVNGKQAQTVAYRWAIGILASAVLTIGAYALGANRYNDQAMQNVAEDMIADHARQPHELAVHQREFAQMLSRLERIEKNQDRILERLGQ